MTLLTAGTIGENRRPEKGSSPSDSEPHAQRARSRETTRLRGRAVERLGTIRASIGHERRAEIPVNGRLRW